jgi:hypothetical protein
MSTKTTPKPDGSLEIVGHVDQADLPAFNRIKKAKPVVKKPRKKPGKGKKATPK